VLLPVLDERDAIDDCLASLQAQDYDGPVEVVVADGGSIDGTLELLARWSQRWRAVRVLDNPDRLQAHGLNLAAEAASGEILVRADAHTTYAPDYLRRSVEALLGSSAVAVGGRIEPEGRGPFGRAVAAAMRAPLATGPAAFHHADETRPADTVYLGAFRRSDFLAHGGIRALPSGAAEDADLYYRWNRAGRMVLLDPAIRSTYRPRETPAALWRQHHRYGMAKAEMLWLNGELPSSRPLAPLALVMGLALGMVLAVTGRRAPVAILVGAWGAALGSVAAPAEDPLRTALASAVMHLAYGTGLTTGLLRGPSAVAGLRAAP
jgi:glycosyltransferase involved in cell wall biosynthesis